MSRIKSKKNNKIQLLSKYKRVSEEWRHESDYELYKLLYECSECDHVEVVKMVSKGVVLDNIRCPECKHKMILDAEKEADKEEASLFYIRPCFEDFMLLSPAKKRHVLNGGLILSKSF